MIREGRFLFEAQRRYEQALYQVDDTADRITRYSGEENEAATDFERKELNEVKITNPLDDPKVSKDIIADPTAVYGYRPRPGSSTEEFAIDWSDAAEVDKARIARLEYLEAMKAKEAALSLDDGKSMREIAEIKVSQRNRDRIKSYTENGDYENLEKMYNRNFKEYGRKEGPTAEQLLEKHGSYEEIIYASFKVNKGMNVLLNIDN